MGALSARVRCSVEKVTRNGLWEVCVQKALLQCCTYCTIVHLQYIGMYILCTYILYILYGISHLASLSTMMANNARTFILTICNVFIRIQTCVSHFSTRKTGHRLHRGHEDKGRLSISLPHATPTSHSVWTQ